MDSGGLVSYGPNPSSANRRSGTFEPLVNLKTANALDTAGDAHSFPRRCQCHNGSRSGASNHDDSRRLDICVYGNPYKRMIPTIVGFDWDRGNRDKCQKHGVSIAIIESLFHSRLGVFPDPEHSDREQRFKAIGRTEDRRAVLIVFTLRVREGETLIRPISARYMRRKEIDHYEKETAEAAYRRRS